MKKFILLLLVFALCLCSCGAVDENRDQPRLLLTDAAPESLRVSLLSQMTFSTRKMGDVNGDGIVDYTDAMKALRVAVSLETVAAEDFPYADVDGDDTIDYTDAMKILRAAVGLEELESQKPEHQHDYKAAEVAPTCENEGYTEYTCDCGDSYRDNVKPATGHDYKTTTVEPTTEAEGYDLHTCNVCGDTYQDHYTDKLPPDTGSTEPTEHVHDFTVTVVEPTCSQRGFTLYECACGRAYRENPTEPTYKHSWSVKTIAPTTYSRGYDLFTCTVCETYYMDNLTDKLPSDGSETDNSEHIGCYLKNVGNMDGVYEWVPNDCETEGHRYKMEVLQEATHCCQPKITDRYCVVVGCDHHDSGYPKEEWEVPHLGDASLLSYESKESYTVRRRDGQAWTFSTEAEARAMAKKVADAYRNGESIHWVERIQSSGFTVIYPENFVCQTCGQTLILKDLEACRFTGTFPENPYESRRWVENYTKDNQPA